MDKELAEEIMSKVMSYWDDTKGIENCHMGTITAVYQAILESPQENGLMPIHVLGEECRYVPIEEMILFGVKAEEIKKYPTKEELKNE